MPTKRVDRKLIQGKHEPLVSIDLWERVQNRS
jgi:hypothetical protein